VRTVLAENIRSIEQRYVPLPPIECGHVHTCRDALRRLFDEPAANNKR
jgi:hypothetical protein